MLLGKIFRKVREHSSRPVVLEQCVVSYLSSLIPRLYSWVMLVLDRSISRVCIPFYDVYFALRKKSSYSVDVHMCSTKYTNSTAMLEGIEQLTLAKTLSAYLGDDVQVSFSYWDDGQPILGYSFGFYRRMMTQDPKYLILVSYSTGVFYQPAPWILSKLKKRNTCLIALWVDTCTHGFIPSISPIIDIIDLHVFGDNPTMDFGDSNYVQRFKEKSLLVYLPCMPYEVEVKERKKDIDVVFLGQIDSYRNVRKPYLEFLFENSVNLYCFVGDKDDRCSYEKLYEVMSRAKIGVNFSMSGGVHQVKGRVMETMMTGGLLLEQRNNQTACYFSEGNDYVAFSSKEELVEKIKYYLAHEEERAKIAAAGEKKSRQLYNGNGKLFWGAVFDSLDVKF